MRAADDSKCELQMNDFGSDLKGNVSLKDTILFVDEALPTPSTEEYRKAKERLRFLRNFGRVAGFRIVLAGTAATAASIRKDSNRSANEKGHIDRPYSRDEGDDKLWAEIEFLCYPLKASLDNEGKKKSVRATIVEEMDQ